MRTSNYATIPSPTRLTKRMRADMPAETRRIAFLTPQGGDTLVTFYQRCGDHIVPGRSLKVHTKNLGQFLAMLPDVFVR